MSAGQRPIAQRTRSKSIAEFYLVENSQHGTLEFAPNLQISDITHFRWTIPLREVNPNTSVDTLSIETRGKEIVLQGLFNKRGGRMPAIQQTVLADGEYFERGPMDRKRIKVEDSGEEFIQVTGFKFNELTC